MEDGGFVVAWQSNNQDGSGLGIFGQRYDSSGSAIGNEFRVNSYTNGDQKQASVSGLADGGFVVIWISDGQDGSGFGVFGQRYDANSSPVGSEFAVNTTVEGNQGYHDGEYLFGPALTSLATGGFVVSWTSQGQDGSGNGMYGQLFDSSASKFGSEILLNTSTVGNQVYGDVTSLSDGGFIVSWSDSDNTYGGYGYDVFAQRFNSSGEKLGSEIQINSYNLEHQNIPSITTLNLSLIHI